MILNSEVSVAILGFFFYVVSRLRAGELSEAIGFLVCSRYNLSYQEKAGNYNVRITTIIEGLKNYSNNYSNNQMTCLFTNLAMVVHGRLCDFGVNT